MNKYLTDIKVMDVIEFLGVVCAFIFGIVSWIYSKKANELSEKSLESAKEANKIAEDSLKVAKESNELSERSLKISEKLESDNKESIVVEVGYVRLVDNDDSKVVSGNILYGDYILIVPITITNKSAQPVTIKKFWTEWGKDGEYNYIAEDDLVCLEQYGTEKFDNVNSFPLYLKAKESKKVNIVMIVYNQDDKWKFISKGMTFHLDATHGSYKFYIFN